MRSVFALGVIMAAVGWEFVHAQRGPRFAIPVDRLIAMRLLPSLATWDSSTTQERRAAAERPGVGPRKARSTRSRSNTHSCSAGRSARRQRGNA